jgi:hypothetical protein
MITDTYNGYGGYASQLLSAIRDEYSKTDVLVFGVSPPLALETRPNMPAASMREMIID